MSDAYWKLNDSAAWLDLSSRGKIRVIGEDRARLLHAMSTNHVQQLKPGEGCYVFFLNAQGRILADANLFCFEDHLLLDTEPETTEKLYEHLDRYIIADDAVLENRTGEIATIGIEGPQAEGVLRKMGAPIPVHRYSWMSWGERIVGRVNSTGSEGFFVFVPATKRIELTAELGASGIPEATADDDRTVRIEHGKPRYGEEITERFLVQETGQLHAVHFNKGCYLGQEIVERVRSRAQIHRLLRPLEIESSDIPEPRTKLKAGDADAAEIVSAAFSPRLGKVVAMAYVRTPFAEPGTMLSLGNSPARVVETTVIKS